MTIEALWQQVVPSLVGFGERLVAAIAVLLVGRIIIRLIMKGLRKGKLSKKADQTVARFLYNSLNILLNVVLAVSIIGILGVPMSSVIAIVASAGVAIGLALQGALGNFAGSIMLMVFRPFHLGDYIEVGETGGTVKDIGLFYTVLETPDKKTVTLPNGNMMNSEIVNFSVSKTRRLELIFSVAYGTDVEKMKSVLLKTAAENPMVLSEPAPFAKLKAENSSSLDFTLRVWVKTENYWTVHFDLLEAEHNAIVNSGIEIPFPQMDVHIKGESK